MAYLALYRRFRPQNFDDLIGQEHISKILKNQIKTGKIGHAYLLCGARGTGKTTVAKIFARAINCLNPKDGSPCGECEVCRGLKDPSNMDILEMDAASNNGVDDVREMREKIQYPPVVGKYKVYIVDEVHMLSPAAFNALLKTLEEPPSHAVFIFATTEVHKIPQTILSRCMRFDFRLISLPLLTALVKKVFDAVGKEYDDEAVDAIARAGEGSARDTLSIADMCSSYSTGKLVYEDVLDVFGATDKNKILELVSAMIESRTGDAVRTVDELASLGKGMGVLADDIASLVRDLLIIKTAQNANKILVLPESRYNSYVAAANKTEGNRLLRIADIFSSLDNAFRYTTHPRIVLETAVIRASKPEKDYDTEAFLSRISSVEKELAEAKALIEEMKKDGVTFAGRTESVTVAEPAKAAFAKSEKKVELNANVAAKNDYAEPFDIIPPEDDGGFYGFDAAVPTRGKIGNDEGSRASGENSYKVSAPQASGEAASFEQAEEVPPAKVWGCVLRQLRADKNVVLWTVCRDVKAFASNGVLTIYVSDDGEYEMFSKENHYKTLTDTVRKFGNYTVKIEKKSMMTDETKEFEEDMEKVKRKFGNDIVKIIQE